jgi:16S rRNA (guanine527-N7)-methyltransferase
VFVDANARRARFVAQAVERLGIADRAHAIHARAEDLGRDLGWRSRADLVVARSFGPPAVVAECAAPLLRAGAVLVVSEPPDSDGSRWQHPELHELGLRWDRVVASGALMARLVQIAVCPARYPRRPGVPARRPLF